MNRTIILSIAVAAFMIGILSSTRSTGHDKISVRQPEILKSMLSPKEREDAVCYAQRYRDLLDGFCGGIATNCFEEDLLDHFEETGREEGLVWGCLPGMEAEASCYAMRYPNLFQAYCNNDVEQCDFLGLYMHYRDHGSFEHLLWPCRDVHTKISNAYYRLLPVLPSDIFEDDPQTNRPNILKVLVLIFETDSNARMKTPVVTQMSDKHLTSWLSFDVLGTDTEFKGFSTKWVVVERYLENRTFEEGTYLILIDARDTLLNLLPYRSVNAETTLHRISEMVHSVTNGNHNAVIMSAEGQCCVAALTFVKPGDYFYPDGRRKLRACSSGHEGCMWNGDSEKVEWEDAMIGRSREDSDEEFGALDAFLNSGLVAGFPKSIADLLSLADIEESEDDQAVFTDLFLSFPNRIVLDYDQEMFGNARWTKELRNGGCPFKKGLFSDGLYHEDSLFTPLILHTPGKYWECFDVLQTLLGIHPSTRYETIPQRNRSRALQYGGVRITVGISLQISPVDNIIPTAGDIQALQSTCIAFFSAQLSTVVISCTVSNINYTPAAAGRNLQTGGYNVLYNVVFLETPTLTEANAEVLVENALRENEKTFINQVVAEAIATQGQSSGLEIATDVNVMDIFMVTTTPSSAPSELPSSKPTDEDNCKGLAFIFCLLGKVFGGFGNFLKWVIKILTFGLIS